LPAFVHGDVFHPHRLFAGGPVALECFDLCREGPREFIESPLRTVLLGGIVNMSEPAREGHCCIVSCGHLSREHGLHLVARFYALHQGENEIKLSSVSFLSSNTRAASYVDRILRGAKPE
jgi:hypothetical protein